MDEQLTRIENKLEKVEEKISHIEITLASQHEVLVQHTQRSQMLEEIVLPIQKKMTMLEGALSFLGIVGIVAGIVDLLLKLLHIIN